MATQKKGYFLNDGVTKVPSVTTILGRFKESGGLIHWAWKLGMEQKDYREVRDSAADAGTLAHEAVEAYIKNLPYSWKGQEEVIQKAQKAFGAFKEWADQTQLKITHSEIPLVSEKYRFGGTLDAMLINGKRSLGDWKSSNALYTDYLCQLGGYGILWEENFPDMPIDGGYVLVRFDKEFGDFTHKWWNELDTAKKMFLNLREAYELEKELKKRIK